jgi:putative heme-binding domain-containing protein
MATPSGSAAGIKVTEQPGVSPIRKLRARSKAAYQVVPNGFRMGSTVYVDRGYRLTSVPRELDGADLIQTANNDDNSTGERWLTAEAIVPIDVWVGIDLRQKKIPNWLEKNFRKESPVVSIDEGARFALYRREFPAGRVELGGNTDDGLSGGKGNYVIAVTMSALQRQPERTTIENVQEVLNRADRDRGELLFRHSQGAGCIKCHSLDQAKNGFGPNLRAVGLRANTQHLVQSIVDPSAVITEGFRQLTIVTQDGKVYSGVLLEESGLTISLGQSTGERVDLPKATIEERRVSAKSAMPELSDQLTPQQVADLTLFLQGLKKP